MEENKQHPVQNVMNTAMQNIKDMIDVNTIIGNPITAPDGTMIIPVSRVGVGFASGGSDFNSKPGRISCSFVKRRCFRYSNKLKRSGT